MKKTKYVSHPWEIIIEAHNKQLYKRLFKKKFRFGESFFFPVVKSNFHMNPSHLLLQNLTQSERNVENSFFEKKVKNSFQSQQRNEFL